ncbi:phospholipase D-like domain-containing protein [Acidipropionibacterium virtanenii]|uniref:Major cardiolipin synthase ClsA n=1 Tax=Acidipropionibacterium virtanenii TaxID=2057246 RepID=A0A344USG4_9ACTN|nr:phospholipase D-like domain-containing protein [Acidipropionibacterium virtanenii]AXE38212.1 Major cardiolipin synthase ClsA [Acidipropionibacterium virtanenii]
MVSSQRSTGRLRTALNRIAGATALAQVVAAGALMGYAAVKRRGRRPYRFPTAPVAPITAGPDEVSVFTFGRDLYEQMLADIGSATSTVYFETFIWKADEVGERFRQALVDAAARGVDVYVVWDQFANLVVDPRFFHHLDGVHTQSQPVVAMAMPSLRNIGRDHRKLLIVDSKVAYVGGYNIGSTYADRWRDTHAKVVGPSVADLENVFVDHWNQRPYASLARRRRIPELRSPGSRRWDTEIDVHRNTPRVAVYPIRNMYLEAIDRASERIWMTQAYLIPDHDVLAALHEACERGVDVRIIIPAESNHVVADWLSRGYYERLLGYGVHLLLYQGAMVHAKTCTIDGIWSTIGTANIDRMSLQGNYEVNISVIGDQVASQMEEIFGIDSRNCLELDADQWRDRSVMAKFTEALLAPWRPFF